MLPSLVPSAAAIIGLFWRLALTLHEIFLERTQTGTSGPRHIYQVLNALWETVKLNMCVRCGVVHWPPLQSQFSCGCVSGPVCGAPPPPPRCTPSSPPPAPCPPGTAVYRYRDISSTPGPPASTPWPTWRRPRPRPRAPPPPRRGWRQGRGLALAAPRTRQTACTGRPASRGTSLSYC